MEEIDYNRLTMMTTIDQALFFRLSLNGNKLYARVKYKKVYKAVVQTAGCLQNKR